MGKSRGIPVGTCSKCGASICDAHPYLWCAKCRQQLPPDMVARLPDVQAMLAAYASSQHRRGQSAEQRRARPESPPPRQQPSGEASPLPVATDEISHARVLGLRGKVTFDDIKRCYRERMQEYHPDKVSNLGQKIRDVAEIEAKKINAAYEFFTE